MKLASYMRGLGIGMAATALILHFSGGTQIKSEGGDKPVAAVSENTNKRLSEVGEETPTPEYGGTFAGMIPDKGEPQHTVSDDLIAGLSGVSINESDETAAVLTPTEGEGSQEAPTATKVPTATQVPTATHAIEPTATKAIEPTATKAVAPTATPVPEPTKAPTPTPLPVVTPTSAASASAGGVSLNGEEKEVVVISGDDSYSVSRKMADAGIIPSAAEFDKYMCANKYDRRITTGIHKIPANCSYQRICEILTTKAR
ncbi:MAG: hypothetical protein IJM34_05175 [Lachnospiraceae bacterium]|nr:hypothetical protein [Lachnospiraceae bacterium]